MTSRESNNSNVSKANGIHIEIWEPELIVLPIPENKSDANTLLQIQVFITNNTATTFPLIDGILMPELVKPEDELLQPQKLINRNNCTEPIRRHRSPTWKISGSLFNCKALLAE